MEVVRFAINGLVATFVHFAVLSFNLEVLAFDSAGVANFLAAIVGILTSFLGSRYFVFCNTSEDIFSQAMKFAGLYGVIAVLHGAVMYIFVDIYFLDYRLIFVMATAGQVCLSYFGNKFLVFKE